MLLARFEGSEFVTHLTCLLWCVCLERDSELSNVTWPWFKQQRTLLQVFLSNEIERIVFWVSKHYCR